MPLISHPDIDAPVLVPESAVRVHEKSGWRRVEDAPTESQPRRGTPSKSARSAEVVDESAESNEPQEG